MGLQQKTNRICILGSHKMKGILRVILLEEPNLEENTSQLEGKYYDISLACIYNTTKTSVYILAYRLHDKLQKTYSANGLHENSMLITIFSTRMNCTCWININSSQSCSSRRSPRPPHGYFDPCSTQLGSSPCRISNKLKMLPVTELMNIPDITLSSQPNPVLP